MADYIYTVSKKKFYPLTPNADDIDITDIAHALSMIARANGHFEHFHSVAAHCVECAKEAIERGHGARVCLACLLHDSAEAYLSDVTTPVKDRLADYSDYETRLIEMVYSKYIGTLTDEEKQIVHRIDKELLYHEFYYFMHIELGEKTELKTNPDFTCLGFGEAKEEFLRLFNSLSRLLLEE